MEKVVLSEEETECKGIEKSLEGAGMVIRGITSDQSGEAKSYFQTFDDEAIALEDDLEKYENISVTIMREGESEALLVTEEGVRGGTAAADQVNNTIYINENYLTGKFTPEITLSATNDVFTTILGLIVHEIAHFAYSPADLKPFAKYVKEHSPFPYHEKMAMTLGNVVEDIFIEAQVDRDVPSLTWMVDKMNDLLFTVDVQGYLIA